MAVRDYWDADDSAVQNARQDLEKTLGLPVRLAPEWPQLLQGLDKAYPERDHLVRTVAGCVAVWYRVLQELMDDADGADDADGPQQLWLQTLLDRIQPAGGIQCFLEVSTAGSLWSDTQSAFLIQIPQQAIKLPTELTAAFRAGILHCFAKPLDLACRPAVDDWADVDVDQATGMATVSQPVDTPATTTTTTATTADYLPSLDSLPRPDELFRQSPYYLSVDRLGQWDLEVTCSHGPSLQLLGEYLKRWARTNHSDVRKPSLVEITLQQSCFATGIYSDRLVLVSQKDKFRPLYAVNPTMVLAFVEGVLGYTRVTMERGSWMFRRDVPFKE